MITVGFLLRLFIRDNTTPAAYPNLTKNSAVIGEFPTFPLIPSVPKYFFFTQLPYTA
jgi:hypothetical protein